MKCESGFSLIEIIIALILVGLLAVVAGMGLVIGTQGYLFARENTQIAQKGQLAMARLSRELMELIDVSAAASSSIIFESTSGNRAIALVDDEIKIRDGSSLPTLLTGDALVDNVAAGGFTLSYFKGTQTWVPGTDDIKLLSAIQIDFVLTRSDSGIGDMTFSTTINPRNNKNYGGAPPTSQPPTQPNYCFVTSAAYGVSFAGLALLVFWIAIGVTLLLFISWVIARPGLALIGNPGLRRLKILRAREGSALIGLLVTIVIFAALGAGMLSMTDTSTFNQIGANFSTRAYFLSESGFRYIASEFLNASSEAQKEAVLEALHNQTFTLLNNAGQFHLDIYPYWFVTTANPAGSQWLQTKVTGGLPPELSLSAGYLEIDGTIYRYKNVSVAGSNVAFQIQSGNWPSIPVDSKAHSRCSSSGPAQTVTEGGNLNLKPDTGEHAFPPRNGQFTYDGHTYNYKELDLTNSRLIGITDPDDETMAPFVVAGNSDIIMKKFVEIRSTGTFGQGPLQTSREITYFVPIGWVVSASASTELHETFENLSNWHASTLGEHEISSRGGDNALHVQNVTTTSFFPPERQSLIAFDWSGAGVNLAQTWELAGHFLSYDLQTKLEIKNQNYYAAGISFRMDTSGNSLGGSYLREDLLSFWGWDLGLHSIPFDLVPVENTPLIVLWRQTNSFSTHQWLAYKVMQSSDHVITANGRYLEDWSTLVIRVKEAAGVSFNSGGTTPIADGDTLTGQTSGATGTVSGNPLVGSGSWASGNAAGWILLTNLTGTFQAGEALLVSGQDRATAQGFRPKDNYIRMYYGDVSAHGTANSNPLDNNRLSNPRGQVAWPPDEAASWDASNDNFTLVQWDNVDGSVTLLSTLDEPNAIIRINTFTTPGSGTFAQPEIGLHTFGNASTVTYFDDFAIKIGGGGGSPTGFLPPVQQ